MEAIGDFSRQSNEFPPPIALLCSQWHGEVNYFRNTCSEAGTYDPQLPKGGKPMEEVSVLTSRRQMDLNFWSVLGLLFFFISKELLI